MNEDFPIDPSQVKSPPDEAMQTPLPTETQFSPPEHETNVGGQEVRIPVTDEVKGERESSPLSDSPELPADTFAKNSSDESLHQEEISESWDLAHDEKYAREGKAKFLEKPKLGEALAGSHKSDAIDSLYQAYLNGEHVTVEFNGETMNSREIGELGVDRAYEKYFGYDKEGYREHSRLESDARRAEYALKQFDEANKAKLEVHSLLEQSDDLIKPDVKGEWRECLEIRAQDLYHGSDSRGAIELMKAHSQGRSDEELQKMLNEQGDSGVSYSMKMAIIKHFYKSGDNLVGTLS